MMNNKWLRFHRKGSWQERLTIEKDFCMDCGLIQPPMFVVYDELWQKMVSVSEHKNLLCLDCFEERLGRQVTIMDLKDCGITRDMKLGIKIHQTTIREWIKPLVDKIKQEEKEQ